MRAPHLILPSRAARTAIALLVALALGVALLVLPTSARADPAAPGSSPVPASPARAGRAPVGTQDTISGRGDAALTRARADGRDVPTMPAGCFGPGQASTNPDHPCHLNSFKQSRPTVVLWGDSHAWQMIPATTAAVQRTGVNLVSFVAGSCAPLKVHRRTPEGVCERSNAAALAYVTSLHRQGRGVKVLLGSNWSGFRVAYRRLMLEQVGIDSGYEPYTKKMVMLSHEGTPALFTRLGSLGVDVDVIAQAAVVPDHTLPCPAGQEPYQCDIARWRALPEEGRTSTWLKEQLSKITGRRGYIETKAAYCTALVCHGSTNGIATFFDDLHLSATRSRSLAPYFRATFTSMRSNR